MIAAINFNKSFTLKTISYQHKIVPKLLTGGFNGKMNWDLRGGNTSSVAVCTRWQNRRRLTGGNHSQRMFSRRGLKTRPSFLLIDFSLNQIRNYNR